MTEVKKVDEKKLGSIFDKGNIQVTLIKDGDVGPVMVLRKNSIIAAHKSVLKDKTGVTILYTTAGIFEVIEDVDDIMFSW